MAPLRSTRDSGLAALACTECRKQHLKCDASKPSCSRCSQSGLLCQYLPSRRGGRRKPRHDSMSQYQTPTRRNEISVSIPYIGLVSTAITDASSPRLQLCKPVLPVRRMRRTTRRREAHILILGAFRGQLCRRMVSVKTA